MKIEASLITSSSRMASGLALLFAALAIVTVVLSILFGSLGIALRSERVELEARLEKAKAAAAEVTEAPLPPRAELVALRARVAALNSMAGTGGGSLMPLLVRLEAAMPDEMALNTLRYRRRESELLLLGEASRAEQLTQAMQKLERDAGFRDVRLLRQGEASGGRAGLQFEMSLRDGS